MKIRKDGIYKTIDAKDFGIYQAMGFEKVVEKAIKVVKPEPEPIVEEVKVEEEKVDELPKSKKKKK